MTFEVQKDGDGYFWAIPKQVPIPQIECWWQRYTKPFRGKMLKAEHFIIRQENATDKADVITLTQGQVYDLIKVLNDAVLKP